MGVAGSGKSVIGSWLAGAPGQPAGDGAGGRGTYRCRVLRPQG